MKAFEARAIENIATAPATPFERRGAAAVVGILTALFAAAIPFASAPLPRVAAVLPAIVGAAILAMVLTTVLLYVQYRIERDLKLALLALAYGTSTSLQIVYLYAFPQLFGSLSALGAGLQTAAYAFFAGQLVFAGFVIAVGVAARRDRQLSRDAVRLMFVASALVLAAYLAVIFAVHGLPAATDGSRFTPGWRFVAVPLACAVQIVAIGFVARRWRTVTEVWIPVVLLARLFALITGGVLSGGRFSFGWYAGRLEELVASVVVLAVFLVKINALMLRFAARTELTAAALEAGEARYGALANVVPQLIWTADADGVIGYVNDRWTAYTGLDALATRAAGWNSAIDGDHEVLVRDRWQRSLRTGEPFAAECRLREGATGRYRWFLVNAVAVRTRRGEVATWIGTCTDVDVQKRLEEREAFLARAGERLVASLDVTATVAAIRGLVVPRLAERAWIALVDEDGRYVLAGIGSTELSDELDTRRWIGAPIGPALQDAIAEVAALGEPVVLDKPDRFPDPWIRELPAGAAMVAPLQTGDVAVGVLVLVRGGGRAYDVDDAGLVREFARRAALSLEHGRRYERERTTADALQRAMLPAQLPQVDGLRFSASYSAASETQRVGGDFYDAFELPDGRVALAIGDVTGHGLEAAVVMGEIRQAIRAAAFESADPATILDRASRLLIAGGRSLFVTAVFGILDRKTGRFVYATAGHPAPLVHHDGAIARLPTAGLPLGLRDEEGVDFALRLRAPCALLLYTDGLLEFARDLQDGERRIEHALRELAGEDLDHLASALMKQVLGEDEATDDIAILTVQIGVFPARLPGEENEWRFSTTDRVTGGLVRREVGVLTRAWTGSDDARFAAELAFGELIANAVRYAPGTVRAVLSADDQGAVRLIVEDDGPGFIPTDDPIDPLAETGRGLSLVRAVAGSVTIERSSRGGARAVVDFGAVPQLVLR